MLMCWSKDHTLSSEVLMCLSFLSQSCPLQVYHVSYFFSTQKRSMIFQVFYLSYMNEFRGWWQGRCGVPTLPWIEAAFSMHFIKNKVKVLDLLLPSYSVFHLVRTGRDKDCVMIRLAIYFSGILFCALGILHSREKK